MDFGFRRVLRGKEVVEIFLRIYHVCVRVSEFLRTRIERILNRDKNFWSARGEFVHPHRLLVLHRLIAPAHRDRILFEITRPDLNSQRHTFLDPFPILSSAAEITPIDFNLDRNIIGEFFRT